MIKKIGILIIGMVLGAYIYSAIKDRGEDKFVNSYPIVKFNANCVDASDKENDIFSQSYQLYKNSSEENILSLKIGIEKFLAHGIYRRKERSSIKVCPPKNLYNDIGVVITKNKGLEARLEDYQLRVIQKVEQPTEYILNKVAEIAFAGSPYIEVGRYSKDRVDLRPRARVILAQNLEASLKYASKAYNEISSTSPMGTTAAQIAAKANYRDSLEKIEALMNELIDTTAKGEALSFHKRDRFRELSNALILAGEPAKTHTSALEKILDRKVKSAAGWFGALDLHPKRMCDYFDTINPQNEVTKKYDYCRDDDYPYAQ